MASKLVNTKQPVRIRFKPLAHGNKSIYLDIYQDGKRTYEFLKLFIVPNKTPSDKVQNNNALRAAEAIKAQRILDITNGKAGIKDFSNKSKLLLKDWMQHYYEIKIRTGQSQSNATTIKNIIMHLIVYRGEKIMMRDVDKDFCIGFVTYLSEADTIGVIKKKLSKSTAHLYFNTFISALNEAVRDGIIPGNPVYKLKKEDKKPICSQYENRTFLTIEEVKALINTKCGNEMVKKAFLFACFCGLRISDIISLRWSDLQEDGNHYVVNKVMKKTRRALLLPLSAEAKSWLPVKEDRDDDDVIFVLPKNTTINSDVKAWAIRAGITKDICFHVSRHTFATTLLTMGADLYTTSKLLGHQNLRTTQVYAEIVNQKKVDAVDLLNNIFSDHVTE